MELSQHGFLEELLAPRFSSAVSDFIPNGWGFDCFDENPILGTSNPSFSEFSTPTEVSFQSCPFGEPFPFADGFTGPKFDFPSEGDFPSVDEEIGVNFGTSDPHYSLEEKMKSCKVEVELQGTDVPVFNMGFCGDQKKTSKSKKLEGQPSKNLMAERRRRKRLNDRLSMLRSIVPKISKMDRTAILGDTIDYMKELLGKINKLQEDEEIEVNTNHQVNLMARSKELKPNEVLVRNSPKFDVERRDNDTRIDICCAAKAGLLLSTVNTLEGLGLEIQQCVVSCFNDFSMQASCSEVGEHRSLISCEDIKQALFRNAGYGGRCL